MINEIKTEISKMVMFYQDMLDQYQAVILEIRQNDSVIDTEILTKLIQSIIDLNTNLVQVISDSDSSDTDLFFEKLTTSIEKTTEQLSGQERTSFGDKILGLLDTSREMHVIQWDYFETFEELLKEYSTNQ